MRYSRLDCDVDIREEAELARLEGRGGDSTGDGEKSCAILPPTVPPLAPITSGYGERLRISPSLLLAACALIPREKTDF